MIQRLQQYLSSSIGKKNLMGLTGLALCGFLVSHLLGNLLILCSAETFNNYGHALITNPLIIPAELGLLAVFLMHIGLGMRLAMENKLARPKGYHLKVRTGRGESLASATMPLTGLIILVFLVLHLLHFKWGTNYSVTYGGVEMRDLHRLVMELFSSPGYVAWYVFCMIVLGFHVSHGLPSAFQSLGLNHPRYFPPLKCLGKLFGLAMTVGYSVIPIWCYLQGGN